MSGEPAGVAIYLLKRRGEEIFSQKKIFDQKKSEWRPEMSGTNNIFTFCSSVLNLKGQIFWRAVKEAPYIFWLNFIFLFGKDPDAHNSKWCFQRAGGLLNIINQQAGLYDGYAAA